jgi:hypothetical protein
MDGELRTNTVGCRYNATLEAQILGTNQTQRDIWCPRAGLKVNYCGSICEVYCNMTIQGCGNGTSEVYKALDVCNKTCELFDPSLTDFSSNSLGCRMNQISSIATLYPQIPTTVCPRLSAHSDDACKNAGAATPYACDNYCNYSTKACVDGDSQYGGNRTTCLSYCKLFPLGQWNDTAGNTLGCRLYHTVTAYTSGDKSHCKHGNSSGENNCGSWCDVYCDLATRYCTASNELYSSLSTCMTSCANIPITGVVGSDSGNTVQCRITHLQLAGITPSSAGTNCVFGSLLGGLKCSFGNGTATSTSTSTGSSGSSTTGVASTTGGALANVVSLFSLLLVLIVSWF